jgi:uncharacterized protein YndB with AHSA1/START domain
MTMGLIWIFAFAVASIALLIVIASRSPDEFSIERSQLIAAPPEAIYPFIADLKVMNTWNPFALRDPKALTTYTEPSSGVGARHSFDGKASGTGSIEITQVEAPSHVAMRLVMSKPMAGDNRIDFRLTPEAGNTRVSWAMRGKSNLFSKLMCMMGAMDRMVGKDFVSGLQALEAKVVSEANRRHHA